ncbi:hypothetical protein MRX96_005338 [Rhipicephalus microplus]
MLSLHNSLHGEGTGTNSSSAAFDRSPCILLSWRVLQHGSTKHVAARLRAQQSVRGPGYRGCGHEHDESGDRAALAWKRVKSAGKEASRPQGSHWLPSFAASADRKRSFPASRSRWPSSG